MTDVKQLFQFSPASGFWASLRVLSSLVYGVSTLGALPMHLVLHRRIGERYLNPILYFISAVIWLSLLFLAQPILTQLVMSGQSRTLIPLNVFPTLVRVQYGLVLIGLPLLYALHRYGCWRRDRAGDYVHSKTWGIPTYILPGTTKADATPQPVRTSTASKPPENLFDEIKSELQIEWQAFVRDRKERRIPGGIIPWSITTVAQPIALLMIGALMIFSGFVIGSMICYAGIGMFLQGRIAAAFFREEVLDHRDSRIEQEIWLRVIQGKPHQGEQQGYAIPVASTSISQGVKDSIAARLIQSDSRFASILKSPQIVEVKPDTSREEASVAGM